MACGRKFKTEVPLYHENRAVKTGIAAEPPSEGAAIHGAANDNYVVALRFGVLQRSCHFQLLTFAGLCQHICNLFWCQSAECLSGLGGDMPARQIS